MSNYTQVTAFTPKDSLVSGNPAKIIKGSEFDSEFSAISAAIASKTDITDTTAHTTNTSNPHSVTKAQVGLSNVDNTSDANKPVSTATQTALDAKVTGPATTTDNTIARYDGATGKLIQSSSATLDDSGNLFAVGAQFTAAVSASGFYSQSTFPTASFNDTDAAVGLKRGRIVYTNGGWRLENLNDAESSVLLTPFRIDASGNVTVTGGTLGYGAGSGGTAIQPVSKSEPVTVNKPSGNITMHNAALAAGASVDFAVNNSILNGDSTVDIAGIWTAVDPINYRIEMTKVGAGLFGVKVTNITGGSLSDALKLQFNVIKGSAS